MNAFFRMTLQSLGAELDAVHRDRVALLLQDTNADDEALYDRHWQLRELINRVPAGDLGDLQVKARAAQYALENDPDVECDALGSFIELSRSIMDDIQHFGPVSSPRATSVAPEPCAQQASH